MCVRCMHICFFRSAQFLLSSWRMQCFSPEAQTCRWLFYYLLLLSCLSYVLDIICFCCAFVICCWVLFKPDLRIARRRTMMPVLWKNTPPDKKKGGKANFQNTKSGAGEQFSRQSAGLLHHLKENTTHFTGPADCEDHPISILWCVYIYIYRERERERDQCSRNHQLFQHLCSPPAFAAPFANGNQTCR